MKISNRIILFVALSFAAVLPVLPGVRKTPKLVVLISVDQMSPEYFGRFSPIWSGGLHRLYSRGIVYRNCSLGYAWTETGPGHATMATGCYPSKHGILLNEWHDRRTTERIYCMRDSSARPVDGAGGLVSPSNLAVTTVGDWLKSVSPLSRVVSLSIKDRSAILMGGKQADAVSWYSARSGKFVSSSYYGDHLPGFVRAFNEKDPLRSVPEAWVRLPGPCDDRTSPDSMAGEKLWLGSATTFPHPLPEKPRLLPFTPFGDSLVLDLALRAVREMRLGQKDRPDLLCVSLSSTDYIGHYYGPNSVEMCDQLRRLDSYLGDFFASLDASVGMANYTVILTSDHSVRALPEYSTGYGGKPLRRLVDVEDVFPAIRRADSALARRLGVRDTLIDWRGFLNYGAAERQGLSDVQFEKMASAALKGIYFVEDVFFRRDLVRTEATSRRHLAEFRKSYYADRGPDFVIDFKDLYLVTEEGYPVHHSLFCMHVPLILWSQDAVPSTVGRNVRSQDIAPTIARILNVPIPPFVDGGPLKEAVR